MNNQTIFWVWLQQSLGYASLYLPQIVSKYSFAEDYYMASKNARISVADFSPAVKKHLCDISLDKANAIIKRCEECNIQIVSYADEAYPSQLKNIVNPPAVLYVKGQKSVLTETFCIGIVGMRKAGTEGKTMAFKLARDLAKAGVCVVSGGAAGIDINSHRGALDAKGKTICVLGCGHEASYLRAFAPVKQLIEQDGAVISEYPPDSMPTKYTFPMRNRIISGLSRGIVVVEAGERSGSLITVDYAAKQGKDVFAVPGAANNSNSAGTNKLIKDGAIVVTDASDILKEYKNNIENSLSEPSKQTAERSESEVDIWEPESHSNDLLYSHSVSDKKKEHRPEFIIIKELVGRLQPPSTPRITLDPEELKRRGSQDWIIDLAQQYQKMIAQENAPEREYKYNRAVTAYMDAKRPYTREISLLDLHGQDKERFGFLLELAKKLNVDLAGADPIFIDPELVKAEDKRHNCYAGLQGHQSDSSTTDENPILQCDTKKPGLMNPYTIEIPDYLSDNAKKILEVLGSETMHIDIIMLKTGLPINVVNVAVTELEMLDLVEALEGKRYKIRNA